MLRRILKLGAALAALLAAIYLGCGVYLYLQQRELLYFPQKTGVAADQTDFTLTDEGAVLRGWVVNPGQSRALIYFGGNGDAIQKQRENLAAWAPAYTVYLLAYRGYGASDGTPSEAAMFADALALYDDVRKRQTDVSVIGRSLGSGVAIYLAARRPLDRLALVTPFDSVARVAQDRYPLYPVAWMLLDKFESWRYAPQVHCPVLIVEAQNDHTVPAASTERLMAAFPQTPQFVQIANATHGKVIRDPAYAEAITNFLR